MRFKKEKEEEKTLWRYYLDIRPSEIEIPPDHSIPIRKTQNIPL